MAFSQFETERLLIPRWHSSAATLARGELDSTEAGGLRPSESHVAELEAKVMNWQEERSLGSASDVLSSAVVLGFRDLALDAAEYVLESPREVSESLYRLAQSVIDPTDRPSANRIPRFSVEDQNLVRERIHASRKRLERDPRNVLAWVDMALDYAVLGQRSNAERCIRNAVALAPDDRFILRSAARLFIHNDEADRAHSLIAKATAADHDPWLIAAEVGAASAAHTRSRLAKKGRQLIEREVFSPWHVNELAGSLATLELQAGGDKKARRLFQRSLVDPTENSVAQAEWASRRMPNLAVEPHLLEQPNSFEARARHFADQGQWKEALTESWSWFADQPFSAEAPKFGSYIASVCLEEYDECISLCRVGLAANPDDQVLRNNLVFALASLDRIAEAQEEYRLHRPTKFEDNDRVAFLATGGLIKYRQGEQNEGRVLYEEAISLAKSRRVWDMVAVASVYLAQEEIRQRSGLAVKFVLSALDATQRSERADLVQLHERLERYASSAGIK